MRDYVMPKPLLLLVMICVVSLGFSGCGGGDKSTDETTDDSNNGAQSNPDDSPSPDQKTSPGDNSKKQTPAVKAFTYEPKPFPKYQFTYKAPAPPKDEAEIRAVIDVMKKRYIRDGVPKVLQAPFKRQEAIDFAHAHKFLSLAKDVDLKWLTALDPKAFTENETQAFNLKNVIDSMIDHIKNYLPRDIKYSLDNTRGALVISVKSDEDYIKKGAEADPTEDYQIKNNFAREEIVALRKTAIDRVLNTIDVIEIIDTQLENKEVDWAAKRKQVVDWANMYNKKIAMVASNVMPPKGVGDAELAKIAEQVLNDPKLKLGPIERIIVNAPKKPYSRTSYVVDDNVVEKVVRKWDEFQATTIELEDDGKYYLFRNNILYYHEGPHTVPVGHWVLGERFRSVPIPKENIDR